MLLLSSMGVYMMLSIMEVDPSWSLKLAKKHCQSSDWIYIDTTPFYAMMRFSGAALGLSLSGFLTMDVFTSPSSSTKMATLLVGLGLGQVANLVHKNIPREPLNNFYVMEFLLNMVYVIIVVKCYQLLFSFNICGNQRLNNKKKSSYS